MRGGGEGVGEGGRERVREGGKEGSGRRREGGRKENGIHVYQTTCITLQATRLYDIIPA